MKRFLFLVLLAACGSSQKEGPSGDDPLGTWHEECDALMSLYDKAKVCPDLALETRNSIESRQSDTKAKLDEAEAKGIDAETTNEESRTQLAQQCRDMANEFRAEIAPSGC